MTATFGGMNLTRVLHSPLISRPLFWMIALEALLVVGVAGVAWHVWQSRQEVASASPDPFTSRQPPHAGLCPARPPPPPRQPATPAAAGADTGVPARRRLPLPPVRGRQPGPGQAREHRMAAGEGRHAGHEELPGAVRAAPRGAGGGPVPMIRKANAPSGSLRFRRV